MRVNLLYQEIQHIQHYQLDIEKQEHGEVGLELQQKKLI